MYGVSVEIVLKWGKVCWDAERRGNKGGAHTLFYTSPHTLHLFSHSPSTSSPHPHTNLTRLSTHFHTHLPPPHTLSHFPTLLTPFLPPILTSPDTLPSPPPTLSHTHSPYFLTTPTPPPTLPHTLSFTPYPNFSLFSFIAELV